MSRNDKRTRLVTAADELFHTKGVSNTTLANIAALADVPLGNVYYYFKSKDSIIISVLEYRRQLLNQQFARFEVDSDAKQRLVALIQNTSSLGENTAAHGDPLGSLCQELGKLGGKIAEASAELMQEFIDWVQKQFEDAGKAARSKDLAHTLVSSIQGMNLLTLTLKDPRFAQQQADLLVNWLESV